MTDNPIVDINSHPDDYPIPNEDQAKNIQDSIAQKEEIGIFESTIANILNDLKPNEDLKQSFSILEDDYLEVRNIMPVSKGEFDAVQKLFSNESFMKIKKEIDNLPLTGSSIDKLLSIGDLIGNFCRDPMKRQAYLNKVAYYEKVIVKWRRVKGDGNCFFRSLIFHYLEYLILNRNDQMVRSLIFDLFKNINEPLFKTKLSKFQVNYERVLLVLLLINFALSIKEVNESISKALSILTKAFNNYKDFDCCMIMYLRYEIYKYIKDNEGKLYSKTFSVNIGNLLQSQYERANGQFLYEAFYQSNLLEMGKEAEKIIIYITPFVLQMNVKIFAFDFGKVENELSEFAFDCPCEKQGKGDSERRSISLMYLGNHFDAIYESDYFSRNALYLTGEKVAVKKPVISLKIDEMPGTAGYVNVNAKTDPIVNPMNKAGSQVQLNPVSMSQMKMSTGYQRLTTSTDPSSSAGLPSSKSKPQQLLIAQCTKQGECPICHIKVNRNFVCDACHANQLKALLKPKYLAFINFNQQNLLNQKPIYSFKQYLNELLISYDNGAKVTFDKAYNSLSQNAQFNLSGIVQEQKGSLCLCCHQMIQESEDSIVFEMPCGCVLCKTNCLRNFFKMIPFENRSNYSCICGVEYDITQLKYLVNFFKSHGLRKYKNSVIRFVYAKMRNKCTTCAKDLCLKQGNSVNVLEVKDEEIEKIFNISRFHHLICDTCLPSLTESQNKSKENLVKCFLCNSNHYIMKRISTKAEIINDSTCTIF